VQRREMRLPKRLHLALILTPPMSLFWMCPAGRAMHGQDVWSKGTGVTCFKGGRYDKVDPDAETKSVHAIVADGAHQHCSCDLHCCLRWHSSTNLTFWPRAASDQAEDQGAASPQGPR